MPAVVHKCQRKLTFTIWESFTFFSFDKERVIRGINVRTMGSYTVEITSVGLKKGKDTF